MQVKARVVLLNGVGSARKSSIAKALQTITAEPFLHVEMDIFIAMLPDALQDRADGFSCETIQRDGKPSLRHCQASAKPWGSEHRRRGDVSPALQSYPTTSLDWMRRYRLDAAA
jgi:chloramphenicol 3-O-phosphotransferase